jgi:predicted membrane-bound mannosyltransferase
LAEFRGAFPTVAHLLLAFGPFVLVIVVLYSAFFTRWEGVTDAARAPFLWVRTGVSEQTRAWHYYLGILVKLEFPLILGGILGGVVALRRRTRFGMFVTAWAVGIGLAQTLIPYKMPWLIVSMLLPLAVLSGLAAEAVAATVKAQPLRFLATLGFLVMVGSSGWIAYRVNFVRYDDASNTTGYLTTLGAALHLPAYRSAQYGGYVFAQTDRDLLNLVDAIDRASDRWSTRRGTFIYVTSPNLQPLPWYLRDYELVAYGTDLSRVVPHTIVVASTEQRAKIEQLPGVSIGISSFRLRPGIDLLLGVRE